MRLQALGDRFTGFSRNFPAFAGDLEAQVADATVSAALLAYFDLVELETSIRAESWVGLIVVMLEWTTRPGSAPPTSALVADFLRHGLRPGLRDKNGTDCRSYLRSAAKGLVANFPIPHALFPHP